MNDYLSRIVARMERIREELEETGSDLSRHALRREYAELTKVLMAGVLKDTPNA